MSITESTHTYHQAHPRQDKWSWMQAVWFIVLSCGLFWAGAIALLLRFA